MRRSGIRHRNGLAAKTHKTRSRHGRIEPIPYFGQPMRSDSQRVTMADFIARGPESRLGAPAGNHRRFQKRQGPRRAEGATRIDWDAQRGYKPRATIATESQLLWNRTSIPPMEKATVPRTLDEVPEGEVVRITRIGGRGAVRQRLLDMGVMRGTRVHLKRRAPLGDPIQIDVKGYSLAIRSNEARYIEVERATDGGRPGQRPRETGGLHNGAAS
jgi:ferrous iron transport protein A